MKVICKLKQVMDEQGLNQSQLADATGLSPTTVGKLYRNQFERIDKDTLMVLCKFFRKGIGDLFEVIFEEGD
ncbi:helix-turn-helix domain-containing protein [Synechocystis sp. PCC 7509]|uniref:helix-turn-helix domain-containing protein n=1 Tax=Synechocystis sp. PCC 7509 TaxID=927677 RepID=UPI0002ABEA81|nr:helix-turn-helix transcriptional regulator [Synechocystis sp. PCC 7509]